jgi:serine O-acetyltransferase
VNKLWLDIERFYLLCGHRGSVSGMMLFVACFNPRMAPVVVLRLAEFFHRRRLGLFAKFFSSINVFVFGIEVSPRVEIGGGLFLPHTVGTVIGAARIGDNCTIMQGVTLGTSEPEMGFTVAMRPVVGNHVLIGAGAKVIGGITVGDHAKIGANAVILRDVPAHSVAVGVPAAILARQAPGAAEGA